MVLPTSWKHLSHLKLTASVPVLVEVGCLYRWSHHLTRNVQAGVYGDDVGCIVWRVGL